MTSIFENTHSKVTVHILHDDTLTQDNRQKFIRTAEKYSQSVEFHDVTGYREHFDKGVADFANSKSYTIGALFRFAIQDIIPLDKVIYLDCDVIVNMDVSELWHVSLDGKYLAGVLDDGMYTQSSFSYEGIRCKLNGCRASEYINSGILVMNLAAIRGLGDFFTMAAQWLKSHMYSAIYQDQDAYNSLFSGAIKILSSKYNRHKDFHGQDLSGMIIHNIWTKPWKMLSGDDNCVLYWDMFTRSAWGENITHGQMIRTLAGIADSSPKLHKSPRQCLKTAAKVIIRKLTFPNLRRTAAMLFRHILAKITRR